MWSSALQAGRRLLLRPLRLPLSSRAPVCHLLDAPGLTPALAADVAAEVYLTPGKDGEQRFTLTLSGKVGLAALPCHAWAARRGLGAGLVHRAVHSWQHSQCS